MQFLSTHNSAAAYNNLAESNIIHQDSPPTIHQPPSVQGNMLFGNNFTSKNKMDQFDYNKHMLDNFLDPVHNDQVVHSTSFINTRNGNPYTNGEAKRFFSYNDSVPYANNYGSTDYWDPYINPGKNIESYLRHQSIKNLDQVNQSNNAMQNINTFFPRPIINLNMPLNRLSIVSDLLLSLICSSICPYLTIGPANNFGKNIIYS